MRAGVFVASAGALLAWFSLMPQSASAVGCLTGTQTQTFSYTGSEQCYLVPAGASEVGVVAVGAPGGEGLCRTCLGTSQGGDGALVAGYLVVNPGDALYVEVGGPGSSPADSGGGFNGRGNGGTDAGGGGGASDIRAASCPIDVQVGQCDDQNSLASRMLVAGGGGGGGSGNTAIGEGGGNGGGVNSADASVGRDGDPAQGGSGAVLVLLKS